MRPQWFDFIVSADQFRLSFALRFISGRTICYFSRTVQDRTDGSSGVLFLRNIIAAVQIETWIHIIEVLAVAFCTKEKILLHKEFTMEVPLLDDIRVPL